MSVTNICFIVALGLTAAQANPLRRSMGSNADGGTLIGGPYNFCVGDNMADNVLNVMLSGASGQNSQYVVTDSKRNILGLPPSPQAVNFDGAGAGVCFIYHLSFNGIIRKLEVGKKLNKIKGNFDLSNRIRVNRYQPIAGTITGGPYNFMVGDGMADRVTAVEVSGNSGPYSKFVVTNSDGTTILGLADNPEDVNFDGAGSGVCRIYHLSYAEGLTGLMANAPVSGLSGCFDLSTSYVVINRQQVAQPRNGGVLSGGPYNFCVGDNIPDMVTSVSLSGAVGPNSQYIVTDEDGKILGLPPSPDVVNFDAAGTGTCLIYHISYYDGLTGLAAGNSLSDLQGVFDISDNRVYVNRATPVAGSITGGPFYFTVGDGKRDRVSRKVKVSGNSGPKSKFVVTNSDGSTILGLADNPRDVNFDGAPPGVCRIYHLSYAYGLSGLEVGEAVTDLSGCYDLSSSYVVVNREAEDESSSKRSKKSKKD